MGIATMHKSNAVPVFEDDKKLAKDIAKCEDNTDIFCLSWYNNNIIERHHE